MANFLHMAWSSDGNFCVTHQTGVPRITHHNSDGVDYIVVPKVVYFEFCKLLIIEFYVTPLASHLGV